MSPQSVKKVSASVLSQAPDRFISGLTASGDTDWDVIRSTVDAAHEEQMMSVGSGAMV